MYSVVKVPELYQGRIKPDFWRLHHYMKKVQELDIRDYTEEMELYKGIQTETKEQFKILFYEKLPYTVPIATQVALALETDIEGNAINDVFDTTENVRI